MKSFLGFHILSSTYAYVSGFGKSKSLLNYSCQFSSVLFNFLETERNFHELKQPPYISERSLGPARFLPLRTGLNHAYGQQDHN